MYWIVFIMFCGVVMGVVDGERKMMHGAFVRELDDSFVEYSQKGIWLVEFYAPWCGHCKKLEPIYEEVAKRLHVAPVKVGRVTVAKIDCTRFSYVASHFQVRGFPTIKLFIQNQSHTHNGERTLEGILQFVDRAQGPIVTKLSSVGRFDETKAERKDDVYFVFIGPDDPHNDLYEKYVSIAESFLLHSYFYSALKKVLPSQVEVKAEPTVLVFKDGIVLEYEADELSTSDSLREWINVERFPAFPRAGGSLVNEMARVGKKLVMVVVGEGAEGNEQCQRVKNIANEVTTQHREKYHRCTLEIDFDIKNDLLSLQIARNQLSKLWNKHGFQFLWLQEAEIANNIVMATMDLPGILVLDPATQFYYIIGRTNVTQLTVQLLTTFLDDVSQGNIEASGGTSLGQRIKRVFYEIYSFFLSVWLASRILFMIVVCIPSFIIGLLVWSLCFMKDDDENRRYDEDGEEILDETELEEDIKELTASATTPPQPSIEGHTKSE